MKRWMICMVAMTALMAMAQETTMERHREPQEWCKMDWFDCWNTTLPRVLLVGDSITIGYTGRVREALKGKATVGMLASSKCVTDPGFVKELEYALSEFPYAVVHFNNGIHGAKYTTAQYAAAYTRVLDLLQAKAGTATIVLVTCTPIAKEENDQRIQERNAVVLELAKERHLPVDDLYALMKPHGLHRDGVHFLNEGIDMQGRQVAACIEQQLPTPAPAPAK